MKYLTKLLFVLLLAAGVTACSDFLKPATPQSKPIESINDVNDLQGLLMGAYSRLSQRFLYGRNWIIYGDVRTSNAFSNANSGRFDQFAILDYQVGSDYAEFTWEAGYEVIANTNLIINTNLKEVKKPQKLQQVRGQAYALRAYTHMMLLLLYGQQYVSGSNMGIPYMTTFGKQENFFPSRLSVQQSWNKIGQDFKKALSLLNPSVTGPTTRITYWGAKALQMRYFLYTGQWTKAKNAAERIVNSGNFELLAGSKYVKAWGQDGEPQFIFGVAMTQTDNRGINGLSYILLPNKGYSDVEVTEQLYKLFSASDIRKKLYTPVKDGSRIHYRVTAKYPDRYVNVPVIRYAEVVLTYSETLYRLNNEAKARKVLNNLRTKRGLNAITSAANFSLDDILLARRKELAMEGHYYWDRLRNGKSIKRQNMRPAVSAQEMSFSYGHYRLALPIPAPEMLANPNIKQNKGYTGLSQ